MKRNKIMQLLFCALCFAACSKPNQPEIEEPPVIKTLTKAELVIVVGKKIDPNIINSTFLYNCVTAYNADGSVAWTNKEIGNGFTTAKPYYAKGILYFNVTNYDNSYLLIALDAKTGKMLWKFGNNTEKVLTPAFYNDTVYCSKSGFSNDIIALANKTGEILWTLPIPSSEIYAVPQTDSNRLYFRTAYSYNLNALDLSARRIVWTIQLDALSSFESLKIMGDLLFINTARGITAYNKQRGILQWSKSFEKIISFRTFNNTVFITDERKWLYAFDAMTGDMKWQKPDYGFYSSTPFVYDGNLYFGSVDNTSLFYTSLNPNTGAVNWRKNYDATYTQCIPMGDNIYGLKYNAVNNISLPSYLMKFDRKNGIAKDSAILDYDELDYLSIINSEDSLITPF